MNIRHGLLVLSVMVTATQTIGCPGLGCGVAPSEGPDNDNGTVTFASVAVGSSEDQSMPFQDSNPNADETVLSASITGADAAAFEVLSDFPMDISAGSQIDVQIRFTPSHEGTSTATLVLNTEAMGPSPVQLQGIGVAAGQ